MIRLKDIQLIFSSIFLMVMGSVLFSCSDEEDPVTSTSPVFEETPVVIASQYNDAMKTMGDISFNELSPVFRSFGSLVEDNKLSPYIDYFTVPGAAVKAVTTGIISEIIANPVEEGDFEIRVTALPGSKHTIVYDHVQDVKVLEATRVEPGDTLGVAGTWSDTVRRTGLGIFVGEGADLRWYCPLDYGNSTFKEKHRLLFNQYLSLGKTPAYDSLCITGSIDASLQ
ncbi:MAG: hypothetical protein V3V99_13810 [candidate division Zixibacteria bacterium]